ncbi:hypothetical protein B0T22DRAFT_442456 [Podospora appendiculata]|uniref:Uncharacterized protein n=1 Tax=Podospora appendiculata TaxID=314037 RepID=A0AAE0X552_9PEZI|nr:hypothetical protein B0T22DRAFT_442456 [Podospora appendiculata]
MDRLMRRNLGASPENRGMEPTSHVEEYSPNPDYTAIGCDVVFVHGLTYGYQEMWSSGSRVSWPTDLLVDNLRIARVIFWGYKDPSAISPPNLGMSPDDSWNNVHAHAKKLLAALRIRRRRDPPLARKFIQLRQHRVSLDTDSEDMIEPSPDWTEPLSGSKTNGGLIPRGSGSSVSYRGSSTGHQGMSYPYMYVGLARGMLVCEAMPVSAPLLHSARHMGRRDDLFYQMILQHMRSMIANAPFDIRSAGRPLPTFSRGPPPSYDDQPPPPYSPN